MPTRAILHNLTPDRVLFCYRSNDADSLEVAQYYSSAHGLEQNQLLSLSCPSDNIISQSEYLDLIERPLLSAINSIETGFSSGHDKQIWVIILGYHLPHGYYPDDDPYSGPYSPPKSIASRLHRLRHVEQNHYPNFTFDRRATFKFFDDSDANELFITAVIDGPTKEVAISLINRSLDVSNMMAITGDLYIDPYGLRETESQLSYENIMLDFISKEVPNLGLATSMTVLNPTSTADPTVIFFDGDSFYWGWFLPRFSKDLFQQSQNQRRVFLYNADNDAASDISADFDENGSDPWCNVAIGIGKGYASTAGAISDPGEENFLQPRPFFETLHRGGSLGEAFLFASPSVDWKIFLIGDPLMTAILPGSLPSHQEFGYNLLHNNEVIRLVKEAMEESIAYSHRQSEILNDIIDINVSSKNLGEEYPLLYGLNKWRNSKSVDAHNRLLLPGVSAWINYISQTTGLTLDQWLSRQSEKITGPIRNVVSLAASNVADTLVYTSGEWHYEFVYNHLRKTLEDINFRLQLSTDVDFTSTVIDINTLDSVKGWKYEKEPYEFVDVPSTGFRSNFSGRRVRFNSLAGMKLDSLEVHYIRWQPLDVNGAAIEGFSNGQRFIIRT